MMTHAKGRYLLVPTNQSPEKLVTQDWRRLGLIA